jgi:hypothetical protein
MRVVVHNHIRGRSLGKFRATAPAHDHGPDGKCHCGGTCGPCQSRLGLLDRYQRDGRESTNLAIDVVYGRAGGTTTRHYVLPATASPDGLAPKPAFVRKMLDQIREHQAMMKSGWKSVDKVEGYFKPN